jgi:hypothetical protein
MKSKYSLDGIIRNEKSGIEIQFYLDYNQLQEKFQDLIIRAI